MAAPAVAAGYGSSPLCRVPLDVQAILTNRAGSSAAPRPNRPKYMATFLLKCSKLQP